MSEQTPKSGLNRRELLSIGAVAGVAAGLGAGADSPARAQQGQAPVVDVAPLSELEVGGQIDFAYPDDDSPATLVRLDGPVEGGVGPDESIVAYSALCTHKGCPVGYDAARRMFICPCHWSSFDPGKGGRMIIGQASQSLPRITLKIESGVIRAIGVEGLIYGRQTNIL